AAVSRALARLCPSESTSYNSIDLRNQRIKQVVHSGAAFSSLEIAAFERHIHEHPLIQYCKKNPAHPAARICDFLSAAQFRRSGLYNEFFRLFGWKHQLAVGVSSGPNHVIGVALTRGHLEFSQRERLLLNLLRPHIVAAYHNSQAMAALKLQMTQ